MINKITQKELSLCFDRLFIDAEDDFFPDPIKYKDLKLVKAEIITQIRSCLNQSFHNKVSDYPNYECQHWDVPKKNYVIRHAVCIHPIDRIIYNCLLHGIGPLVNPQLSKLKYSYPIKDFNKKKLFGENPTENWKKFKYDIKELFIQKRNYNYLLSTDIAGFFEYIHLNDFRSQIYDLSHLRPSASIVELLHIFLRRFSPADHSGIAQNYDPSSFFASAFLDFLDKDMEARQAKYYRYVDDIKVACKTKTETKRMIIEITHSLRKYNLNLATHKTEIWHRNDRKFKEFMQEFPVILKEADDAVKNKDKQKINKVLPALIKDVKRLLKSNDFNERLFRAYIWRILKCHWFKDIEDVSGSLCGICNRAMKLIEELPNETDSFVRFLLLHKDRKYVQKELKSILKESIYSWQEMHIWSLLIQSNKIKDKSLFIIARKRLSNVSYSPAARNYIILFLGKHGNYQDRNRIRELLNQPCSYFTKRCIYIALQEHQSRNSIYNYAIGRESDITLKSLAIYLKQSKVPEYIFEDKRVGSDKTFIS
ncbi:MAG: RNA-directed DNA polymerase [Candidatus Omnitrophica bacterium]|nr:RNA-directed DNA polymerase [Candidatus Omnitrophota bacterium]